MTEPGIEFRGVSKRFGGRGSPLIVKELDFTIPKGSLTTILGPSGCGKTTTLRMIAGLESPNMGSIWIDGKDVTRMGPSERNVSLVFQSYALFPHLSVIDNVGYGLAVIGMPDEVVATRARTAMDRVGLKDFDDRFPSELSGGQQQRVALARALVLEPSALLFDEPLSNLDARLRRSMRDEIRSLQQRLQLTVAYVTHDQSEALAVSDQIIIMSGGRIAQRGTPRQLYEFPASEFVAEFMGEAGLFPAEALLDGSVRIGPLRVMPRQPVKPGRVVAAIRPEAWTLEPGAGDGLTGVVTKHTYLGSFQELSVSSGIGTIFVVSPDTDRRWTVGETLTLRLGTRGLSVVEA